MQKKLIQRCLSGTVFFLFLAVPFGTQVWAGSAWYPKKEVEIVVPTAAGGENDRVSRMIQKILQDKNLVSRPVIVINKEGGNQILAAVYMTQHASDPHYLLYTTSTILTNQIAGLTKVHYRDLTPISSFLVENEALTVAANSPFKNMKDLFDALKADPKSVSFGLVARGGSNHLALCQAVRSVGIDPKKLKVVVFKTNGESMTAVMGGHVQVVASSVAAALDKVQAGHLRMLGIGASKRRPGPLANVPTWAEFGIEATGVSNWRGICAPKGLTPDQIAFWEKAMETVFSSEEWRKDIDARNLNPLVLRGKEFANYLDKAYEATKAVMADLGMAK